MANRPLLVKSAFVTCARSAMLFGFLASGALMAGCSSAKAPGQDGILTSALGAPRTSDGSDGQPASSKGELEKATAYWAKEFSDNPRNIDAAVNYAKNLKALGEKDRAMAVLQQASIYNSDHKGLASEYGRSALEADQAGLAERLLARAEDPLKPDWKVISAHGAAIAKQGRHREAIPHFDRALAVSPDNPAILSNLGMAQAMNGDAPKAEQTLRRAMEQPGATPRVRHNLALVLGLQGKFDDARQMAGADMSPEKVAASIAYLRRMVDEQGQAAPAPSGAYAVSSRTAPPLPAPKPAAAKLAAQPKPTAAAKVAAAPQPAEPAHIQPPKLADAPKPAAKSAWDDVPYVEPAPKKKSASLKGTTPATAESEPASAGWSTDVADARR